MGKNQSKADVVEQILTRESLEEIETGELVKIEGLLFRGKRRINDVLYLRGLSQKSERDDQDETIY